MPPTPIRPLRRAAAACVAVAALATACGAAASKGAPGTSSPSSTPLARSAGVVDWRTGCDGAPAPVSAASAVVPVPSPSSPSGAAPRTSSAASALAAAARAELAGMTSSVLASAQIDAPHQGGVLDTDCGGFASLLVNQVEPGAVAARFPALRDLVELADRSSFPVSGTAQPRASAAVFAQVFGVLATTGQSDRWWRGFRSPSQARAGDLLSWLPSPGSTSPGGGHVMVVAAPPRPAAAGRYSAPSDTCPATSSASSPGGPSAPNFVVSCKGRTFGLYAFDVPVIDAATPHGDRPAPAGDRTDPASLTPGEDTRVSNTRNHPDAGGGSPHTGVGLGTVVLLTASPTGPALGYLWSPGDSAGPDFYSGAGCGPGETAPPPKDLAPLVRAVHARCLPGIAFGRLTPPAPPAPPKPALPVCERLGAARPPYVAGRVTAIGDSVMIDVQPALQAAVPCASVDGSVSRQWDDGVALAQQLEASGQLGEDVVVDLGTNGPVTLGQFEAMMTALHGATRVLFVTVHVDRYWQDEVNATLAQGVRLYKNTALVDFDALAAQHPEWFYSDGTHMPIGGPGAQAWAALVRNQL